MQHNLRFVLGYPPEYRRHKYPCLILEHYGWLLWIVNHNLMTRVTAWQGTVHGAAAPVQGTPQRRGLLTAVPAHQVLLLHTSTAPRSYWPSHRVVSQSWGSINATEAVCLFSWGTRVLYSQWTLNAFVLQWNSLSCFQLIPTQNRSNI